MSKQLQGYGVVDLETGEKRFILLTQKQWDKAYKADEVDAFFDYMDKHDL
jgi:hypothetical protein